MPGEAVDVDYMMDNIWIVGGQKKRAKRIRSLYQAVGGFGALLAIPQDPDEAQWKHGCLRLLTEEVGSRVADLG